MKNNPRIERLKEMMNLEEKRVALQQQLDDIMQRMAELKDALLTDSEEAEPTPSRRPAKAPSQKAPTITPRRGVLKDRIMAALEAAGPRGVRVKELARALGTKPVNVHSWFHSSMKRYPAIKKIEGGHYRLEGSGSGSEKRSAPSKSSAKPAKKKKTATRGKRGELTAKILEALKDAGSQGISVKDLAENLGANYRNIYIWFATTGKKNPSVEKVGPAQYRLLS